VTIAELDGEPVYLLRDNSARILRKRDVVDILEAIAPFYEMVSDDDIDQINADRENRRNERKPYPRPEQPKPKAGYVYLLKAGPYCKIGVSADVSKRIEQLATLPPFDIDLLHTIPTDDMYALESTLHERFADKRKNGEWFELDQDDVEYIKGL